MSRASKHLCGCRKPFEARARRGHLRVRANSSSRDTIPKFGEGGRLSPDVRLDEAVDLAGLLHLHHVTGAVDDLDLGALGVGGMRGRNDLVLRCPR